MNYTDIAIAGFIIIVFVSLFGTVFLAASIDISAVFLQQSFCEENGFSNNSKESTNEGYCYSVDQEHATKKYYVCEPSPDLLTNIGECKFLKEPC